MHRALDDAVVVGCPTRHPPALSTLSRVCPLYKKKKKRAPPSLAEALFAADHKTCPAQVEITWLLSSKDLGFTGGDIRYFITLKL